MLQTPKECSYTVDRERRMVMSVNYRVDKTEKMYATLRVLGARLGINIPRSITPYYEYQILMGNPYGLTMLHFLRLAQCDVTSDGGAVIRAVCRFNRTVCWLNNQ